MQHLLHTMAANLILILSVAMITSTMVTGIAPSKSCHYFRWASQAEYTLPVTSPVRVDDVISELECSVECCSRSESQGSQTCAGFTYSKVNDTWTCTLGIKVQSPLKG